MNSTNRSSNNRRDRDLPDSGHERFQDALNEPVSRDLLPVTPTPNAPAPSPTATVDAPFVSDPEDERFLSAFARKHGKSAYERHAAKSRTPPSEKLRLILSALVGPES